MPDTDQLADQTPPVASASAPAPAGLDIEKIKADVLAAAKVEMDNRVAGFQRAIGEKDQEIERLKRAQLPEDERNDLENQDAQARIDAAEQRAAIAELALADPEVGALWKSIVEAESSDDQLDILRTLIKPAAPEVPEAEPVVAEVDRNNPAQTVGDIVGRLPDGTPLTGDTAWDMLRRMGPGATAG
jgi:hypothetical protein